MFRRKEEDLFSFLKGKPTEEIKTIAARCGLYSAGIDHLLASMEHRPSEARLRSLARLMLPGMEKFKAVGNPIAPARRDVDISGDLLVGNEVFSGRPVGLLFNELPRLGAVYGATGFFKTATLMSISAQCIQKGIRVIIIDEKGRQYRSLQRAFPDKVLVMQSDGNYPESSFEIPRGCSINAYYPGLVELRSSVFERKDSSNIFQEILLREHENCRPGESPAEQSLHNETILTRFRPGFDDYHARRFRLSLVTVSTGLCQSSFGKSLAYKRGLDWVEMREKNISIVIEASNLTLQQIEYLSSVILHRETVISRSQHLKSDTLIVLIIIDEGTNPLRDRPGIPPLIEASSQIRQSGLGLLPGMHSPHLAHSLFRTNCFFFICYKLGSEKAVRVVQESLALDSQQASYLMKQPLRHGIISIGDRHPEPIAFVAAEPIVPMDLNIPDEEVQERNNEIMKKLPPVIRWQGTLLTLTKSEFDKEESMDSSTREKSTVRTLAGLTSDGLELLDFAYRCTWPVTQIFNQFKWGMSKGESALSSVLKNGFAELVNLNPSGKQGSPHFLWHSQKYYDLTGKEKLIPGTDGKGAEHCLSILFLYQNLKEKKQCSHVEISRAFEGSVSDVYFRHDDAGYVIEVCCSTIKTESAKISRILKNLDVKAVFVVADKTKLVVKIKQELKNHEFKDRIIAVKLSDFLNKTIEELTQKTGGAK